MAFETVPLRGLEAGFGGPEPASPPEGLATVRARGEGDAVFLHPYLCDRPYALGLGDAASAVNLAPGSVCRVVASLPPVFRFELGPENALAEWTPFSVPQTFLGANTMSGEFCHSIPAFFEGSDGDARWPALVRCEISLTNRAATTVSPGRLAVYPEQMSVYAMDGGLATDELEIDLCDSGQAAGVPRIAKRDCPALTAGARYGAGESLARLGIGIIKNITHIGSM